jgi:hypothetical protein
MSDCNLGTGRADRVLSVCLCGERPACNLAADCTGRLAKAIKPKFLEAIGGAGPSGFKPILRQNKAVFTHLTRTTAFVKRVQQGRCSDVSLYQTVTILKKYGEQHLRRSQVYHPAPIRLKLRKRQPPGASSSILFGL